MKKKDIVVGELYAAGTPNARRDEHRSAVRVIALDQKRRDAEGYWTKKEDGVLVKIEDGLTDRTWEGIRAGVGIFGGWRSHMKEEEKEVALELAEKGLAVVPPNFILRTWADEIERKDYRAKAEVESTERKRAKNRKARELGERLEKLGLGAAQTGCAVEALVETDPEVRDDYSPSWDYSKPIRMDRHGKIDLGRIDPERFVEFLELSREIWEAHRTFENE